MHIIWADIIICFWAGMENHEKTEEGQAATAQWLWASLNKFCFLPSFKFYMFFFFPFLLSIFATSYLFFSFHQLLISLIFFLIKGI